jgi:hypothetical protein
VLVVVVAVTLSLLSWDTRAAEAPAVVDHPLVDRGRSGRLAGAPAAGDPYATHEVTSR